ncbi:hypothetical protein [Actinoplanes flavus]|uniref:DUF4384 domain-containing protein n=1 Tax=Actinoplanes flavus TaxID=2820290 RepID=A0ABS3UCP3_9ACTN|nr:hypothetical protein [Actinoplanes flavus]MBO3736540.1 hypothetical protein [Actinoplanes flavus]
MTDTGMHDLLDQAASTGQLPPGFTQRVVKDAQTYRRRRAIGAAGAAAVVAAAGFIGFQQVNAGSDGLPADPDLSAAAALAAELSGASSRTIDSNQILAVGQAGEERLVAVRRTPNEQEAAAGGKAAEIFVASGSGPFVRALDYLSYDYGCTQGDDVCVAVRPTGLGFYVVRQQADGGKFVLVQAPADRQISVTSGSDTDKVGQADEGAVVEVSSTVTPEQIEVWATLPDGRRYRIPNAPGSTIGTAPK